MKEPSPTLILVSATAGVIFALTLSYAYAHSASGASQDMGSFHHNITSNGKYSIRLVVVVESMYFTLFSITFAFFFLVF